MNYSKMSFIGFLLSSRIIIAIFLLILFPIVVWFLSIITNNETIILETVNRAIGIVAILALIFSLTIWCVNYALRLLEHKRKQEQYLLLLLAKLRYLAGEGSMKIFGVPMRISIVDWYSNALSKGKLPTHKIPEIDAEFFVHALDNTIDKKPTFELKKALYLIQDMIAKENQWVEYSLNLRTQSGEDMQLKTPKQQEAMKLIRDAVLGVNFLSKITMQHIIETFAVELPVDEEDK